MRLDPDYSPAPYAQLAAAFTNSGDRDAADDIRYLGREREREAACKETWLRGSCFLQTVLGSVAGYGIGAYTFVFCLGACVLARRRGTALVDRSGGEAQWSHLVLLRQFGAAVARDLDQQGTHRVLQ